MSAADINPRQNEETYLATKGTCCWYQRLVWGALVRHDGCDGLPGRLIYTLGTRARAGLFPCDSSSAARYLLRTFQVLPIDE